MPAAAEPATNGQFTVSLSAPSSTDTVISYTVTGTATPGVGNDYTALSGSVTITAGATSATIDVQVLDDAVAEATESVIVTLNSIISGDPDITINGATNSATVTITSDDNGPPVITTSGGALAYTENDPSTPVDSAVTVTDINDPTLASATVQITGGYVAGEDLLTFTPAAGITGSFDAATGTLTLTPTGPTTMADWQAALQSVAYRNTSDNPSTAPRTVTLIANDGTANSAPSTRTINVTAVNDAPAVTANNLAIGDGATVTLSAANLGATDPDNASSALSYMVSNVANGQFELTSAPGVAITTFTAAQLAAGQVVFVHPGNNAAPAYTVTVSDGSLASAPSTAAVTFTPGGGGTTVTAPPPGGGGGGTTVTSSGGPTSSTDRTKTDDGGDDSTPLDTPAPVSRSSGSEDSEAVAEPVAAAAPAAPVRVAAAKDTKLTVEKETLQVQSSAPTVTQSSQSFSATFAQVHRPPEIRVELGKISLPDQSDGDRLIKLDLDSIRMTSLALSVGAIWWATRAAGLITSLLSSLPAWRNFDPLPVLQRNEDEEVEEDVWARAEEDSEEAAEEEAVTQTFEDARPSEPPDEWRRSRGE